MSKPNYAADNRRRLNIVVVGRSGVGKSSFLNYAAGKKVFETGIGDPITQSYFDVVNVNVPGKDLTYSLFDTKGLEAGKTEEWENAIYDEIRRRDASNDIYDWLHTIIYCIDASSKRIQPFEINAINNLASRNSVLVLLTKKDLVTPEILENLRTQIRSEVGDQVQVLSVCNVSSRTRKGESKASGLEDVLRLSFLGLWEKAEKTLPLRALEDSIFINTKLTGELDLADLCAMTTLVAEAEDDDNVISKFFVTAGDIADITGEDAYKLIGCEKGISFSLFKKVEKFFDASFINLSRTIVESDGSKGLFESDVFFKGLDYGGFLNLSRNSDESGISKEVEKFPGASRTIVEISIDNEYFGNVFHLPSNIDHECLDDWYYRMSVHTYLGWLQNMFQEFMQNLSNLKESLARNIGINDNIIREIFAFYNVVNGSNQKPLLNHKTSDVVSAFEAIPYDSLIKKFNNHCSSVRRALKLIGDKIFNGSERRDAENQYASFQNWTMNIIARLHSKVNEFLNVYESELHGYGQYCIREDELVSTKDNRDNPLKEMIKEVLVDGYISPKERRMLEMAASMQGIVASELNRIINEVKKSL